MGLCNPPQHLLRGVEDSVLDVDLSVGERGPLLSACVRATWCLGRLLQSRILGNRPESQGPANEEQRVDEDRSVIPILILHRMTDEKQRTRARLIRWNVLIGTPTPR